MSFTDNASANIRITASDESAAVMAGFVQRLKDVTKAAQQVVDSGIRTPLQQSAAEIINASKAADQYIGRGMVDSFKKAEDGVKSFLLSATKIGGLFAAAGAGAYVRDAVASLAGIEEGMTRIQVATNATAEQQKIMGDMFHRVAADTGKDVAQLEAEFLDFSVRSGISLDNAIQLFPQMSKHAYITGADMQVVTGLIGQAITAMHIPIEKVPMLLDGWTKTLKGVEPEFANFMRSASANLESFGISGEKNMAALSGIFAQMSEALGGGRRGALRAAEELNKSLDHLFSPQSPIHYQVRAMIAELGLTGATIDQQLAAVATHLHNIHALDVDERGRIIASNNTLDNQAKQFFMEYYANMNKIHGKVTEFNNAVGETNREWTEFQKTMQAGLNQLVASWGTLKEIIAGGINAPLKSTLDEFQKIVDIVKWLDEHTPSWMKGDILGKAASGLSHGIVGGVVGPKAAGEMFPPTSTFGERFHFAKGGIVTEPTLAMVGEEGPEAIIPFDRTAAMRDAVRPVPSDATMMNALGLTATGPLTAGLGVSNAASAANRMLPKLEAEKQEKATKYLTEVLIELTRTLKDRILGGGDGTGTSWSGKHLTTSDIMAAIAGGGSGGGGFADTGTATPGPGTGLGSLPPMGRDAGGHEVGAGSGGTSRQVPRNKREVAAVVADEWRKAGMSEEGIAGLMANINEESSFNPTLRHADQPHFGGEAHFAHGLYQEGGTEWNHYAAWLQKNYPGADWKDPRLQSRFAALNLKANYPSTWARMHGGNRVQAASAYAAGYLKPAAPYLSSRLSKFSRGVPGVEHYTGGVQAPGETSPATEFEPHQDSGGSRMGPFAKMEPVHVPVVYDTPNLFDRRKTRQRGRWDAEDMLGNQRMSAAADISWA